MKIVIGFITLSFIITACAPNRNWQPNRVSAELDSVSLPCDQNNCGKAPK